MGLPIGGNSEKSLGGNGLTGKYVATIEKVIYHTKDNGLQMMRLWLKVNGQTVFPETLWVQRPSGKSGDYNKAIDFFGILGIQEGEPTINIEGKDGQVYIPSVEGKEIGVVLVSLVKYPKQPINGYTKRLEPSDVPEKIYVPDYSQELETKTYCKMFYNPETNQTWTEMQQNKDATALQRLIITPTEEEEMMSLDELDEYAKELLVRNLKKANLNFNSKKWVSYTTLAKPSKPFEEVSTPDEDDDDVPF